MGLLFQTLGAAAGRFADISEQDRIAKQKQEESFKLLDYKFDQDKELFDIRETRAEKQLDAKRTRDKDREFNDTVTEANLYFSPDKMEIITAGGLSGLKLAIERAKDYVANGYDPNVMVDISDLSVDPKELNMNTFSNRFKRVPKKPEGAASTYEAEYLRLHNLELNETDPAKKEKLRSRANNILALTKEPESDGQFLSSKESISTIIDNTVDSIFSNYNQVEKDASGIITRNMEGNSANAAQMFEEAANLLTKKHDRDPTMKKQQGWINRSNTQFWAGVDSLRSQAKTIRAEHVIRVSDAFKISLGSNQDAAIKNAIAGIATTDESHFRLPVGAIKPTDFYANKNAVIQDAKRFRANDVVPFYEQLANGNQVVNYYLFSSFGKPKLLSFSE